MLCWAYVLFEPDVRSPALKRALPGVLTAYGVTFAILHWKLRTVTAFQVHFGLMVACCLCRLVVYYRTSGVADARVSACVCTTACVFVRAGQLECALDVFAVCCCGVAAVEPKDAFRAKAHSILWSPPPS